MRALYNELDPFCVEWLKALISGGHIADGVVDSRPIQEIKPEDLNGFTQCHFFAGIGGWSYAARLAGWPDGQPIWTGSCPCQPFSLAGKGLGAQDTRHLWPDFFRLIRAIRPAVVMGEQTAAASGYAWLDGVGSDLESEDYTWRACDIPACSVNAPHIRNRLYWVAESARELHNGCGVARQRRRSESSDRGGDHSRRLEYASSSERWPDAKGRRNVYDGTDTGRGKAASRSELAGEADNGMEHSGIIISSQERVQRSREQLRTSGDQGAGTSFWDSYTLIGPDPNGKYRRVKPGVRLLASGIPGRVGRLRGYGNAIVPQVAAEVIASWMKATA